MSRVVDRSSAGGDWSRRDVLRLGTLAGLSAATSGAAGLAGSPGRGIHPAFGRARSCLLVFLAGGPSHLDTFDPKPDAPAEVRGEFRPIATAIPGLRLCEHLPRLARVAHRFTVVRSVGHDDSTHGSASYRMLTGRGYPRDPGLSEHLSREDHPHVGSIVAAASSPGERAVPAFVTVPGPLEARGPARAGQHAGCLGGDFDPLFLRVRHGVADRDSAVGAAPIERPTSWASRLLRGEAERDLDRYGRTRFGRSLLLGRRLVEAGVRVVQVNWDRRLEAGWDTHADGFSTLRNDLLPPADRALSALLDDLAGSGLLDETLLVVMGEFGRSPRITPGGGRGHWPGAFSILVAGVGMPGGGLHGATDRQGALPADRPMSPRSLAATILFALGVEPSALGAASGGTASGSQSEVPALGLWS